MSAYRRPRGRPPGAAWATDREDPARSIKHVKDEEYGLQIADHRVVRGKIEWDESAGGSVPLLSIDGREITWQDFGHMLMSFEGWQFKLEIRDNSEDL